MHAILNISNKYFNKNKQSRLCVADKRQKMCYCTAQGLPATRHRFDQIIHKSPHLVGHGMLITVTGIKG